MHTCLVAILTTYQFRYFTSGILLEAESLSLLASVKRTPTHHSHKNAPSSAVLLLDVPNEIKIKWILLGSELVDRLTKGFPCLGDSTQNKSDRPTFPVENSPVQLTHI